jgi:glutathione S-transferase
MPTGRSSGTSSSSACGRRQSDEARIAAALPKARACLAALTELMGEHPFLAGRDLTLADLHAAPMLIYFRMAAEGAALLGEAPGLAAWLERMERRESHRATRSPLEAAR